MNQVEEVTDLEELLQDDITCGDCGNPAQLRCLGHSPGPVHATRRGLLPPHFKCITCWQQWVFWVVRDLSTQGYIRCAVCRGRFDTIASFADYRPF